MSDPYLQWLYIDFNSYFASVEQQMQPRLRNRPIAVVPVDTDSTCAIAASYEAKAFGIRTGTPIYEARKLCPELICVLAQHEKYVTFHHRIVEEINQHIPVTAVCSIDEAACRLMRNEASIEAVMAISQSIKRGLAKNLGEYIRCSIGVASNRYLAKVATDLQKPDGLTILRQKDLPERLFVLALRDLPGIGHNMERRLIKAGITTTSALLSLKAEQMRTIWGGVWGERMWHLLRGVDLPELETQRRTIGHSHIMAPELRQPAKAVYVARRLALKAASRLRRMEYYASELSLSIRVEQGPGLNSIRLEGNLSCWRAQDNMTFLHLLDRIWQKHMQAIRVQKIQFPRIKKISITLYGLVETSHIVADLLESETDERFRRLKAENISRAMDKLNQRFGRDTVALGMLPSQGKSFTGTKIAFTRIPDREEFLE